MAVNLSLRNAAKRMIGWISKGGQGIHVQTHFGSRRFFAQEQEGRRRRDEDGLLLRRFGDASPRNPDGGRCRFLRA